MPDIQMPDDYPAAGFLFLLEFSDKSGTSDASFQEVSGIGSELGFEEVGEGGENRFKHQLPLGAKHSNLVLKRGIIQSDSSLSAWCKSTLESDFSTQIITQNIDVSLMNYKMQKLITWQFIDAWPVKWSISNLNSMENAIASETLEFTYKYFTRFYINPKPLPK